VNRLNAMSNAVQWYFLCLLIALDQFLCAVFGGWPDETVSSYVLRLEWNRKLAGLILRPVVDTLFSNVVRVPRAPWIALQFTGHCRRAYDAERLRAQMPPELRGPNPRTLAD
jgi:hypothetical protein